ncbi:SCP-like protein, partial [Teladorsagia circumcincta]
SKIARSKFQNAGNGPNPPAANMYMMKWDCELENKAYELAVKCPPNLNHSRRDGYGVNMYATWKSGFPFHGPIEQSFNQSVMGWCDPLWVAGFYYWTGYQKMLDTMPYYDTFSQVIWAKSYKVGCYAQPCHGQYAIVCAYAPGGCIVGEPVMKVGEACSACPNGCVSDGQPDHE